MQEDELKQFFVETGMSEEQADEAVRMTLEEIRAILPVQKLATTAELIALNKLAVARGLNRAIDPETVEALDPDGVHVSVFALYHDYAAGQHVEPHVRAVFLVKLADSMTPTRVIVDCDAAVYMLLKDFPAE